MLQPFICARFLVEEAAIADVNISEHEAQSGGDDLPDAYRYAPAASGDYPYNIVAVKDPSTSTFVFQIMFGLLFGHSSAVMNFNRWSRFLESVSRRVLILLLSMYYDDASLLDLLSANGNGQACLGRAFGLLGASFAPKKQQRMSLSSDFLGVLHGLDQAFSRGVITMTPREHLVDSICSIIDAALRDDFLAPGTASQPLGKVNAVATSAMYGLVGRAGLRAVVQRVQSDSPPYTLSVTLRRSLAYECLLFRKLPPKVVALWPPVQPLVVIASDAQADPGLQPSAGAICLAGPDELRIAVFGRLPEQLLTAWGFSCSMRDEGRNPIAICEASVVLFVVWQFRHLLAGRHIIWFVDNTSALYSFVKRMCKNSDLSRCVEALHI